MKKAILGTILSTLLASSAMAWTELEQNLFEDNAPTREVAISAKNKRAQVNVTYYEKNNEYGVNIIDRSRQCDKNMLGQYYPNVIAQVIFDKDKSTLEEHKELLALGSIVYLVKKDNMLDWINKLNKHSRMDVRVIDTCFNTVDYTFDISGETGF